MAIGISAICFQAEDGSLHVREGELIRIYGHEGMGHAVNWVLSKSDSLPYILSRDTVFTIATAESLAQYYQKIIFDDLKKSPQTQKELGIHHKFDEIYREHVDTNLLEEYKNKLSQYAITVMADKTLGKHDDELVIKKKMELLSQVAIDPNYPLKVINSYRNEFDTQGNLNWQIVSELRYCALPVQRGLEEFAKKGILYEGKGRSIIDETFLTGFWTPAGFVENARLAAEECGK